MNSKKEFVEALRARITVEEWALGPAECDSDYEMILMDREGYETGEFGEKELEYEEDPGYCDAAVVLRDVGLEFEEVTREFADACRYAKHIYDWREGPGLVWKSMADFEWDLGRYLEDGK